MDTPRKPGENFRHREQRDPLKEQTPGIGKQPYRGNDTDERASLNEDKSMFENRDKEAGL